MRRRRSRLRWSRAACRAQATLLILAVLGVTGVPGHAHPRETAAPEPPAGVPVCPAPDRRPVPDRKPILPPRQGAHGFAAVGMVGLAWCLARRRPAAVSPASALALAAGFTLFVIAGSPHLVHHTFDADRGAACAVFQAASHADGPAVGPTTCPVPPVSGRIEIPGPRLRAMARARPASSRGPPAPRRPSPDSTIVPGV